MASKEGLIPVLLLVSDFYLNWVEGVQERLEGHHSQWRVKFNLLLL